MPVERVPSHWCASGAPPRGPRSSLPLGTRSWGELRDGSFTGSSRADRYRPNIIDRCNPDPSIKSENSRAPSLWPKSAEDQLAKELKEQKKQNEQLKAQVERLKGFFENPQHRAKFERLNTQIDELELENKRREVENKGIARRINEWSRELKTKDRTIQELEVQLMVLKNQRRTQESAQTSKMASLVKEKDGRIAGLERELVDTVLLKGKMEKEMEAMKEEMDRMDAQIRKQGEGLKAKVDEVTILTNKLRLKEATLNIREEQLRAVYAAKTADKAGTDQATKRKVSSSTTDGLEEGEIKDSSGHPPAKRYATSLDNFLVHLLLLSKTVLQQNSLEGHFNG